MKHERTVPVRIRITKREQELLDSMAEGLMDKEISAKINMSVRMVKFHRFSLRMKAGLYGLNSGALMVWAFRNKLVK